MVDCPGSRIWVGLNGSSNRGRDESGCSVSLAAPLSVVADLIVREELLEGRLDENLALHSGIPYNLKLDGEAVWRFLP